MGRNGTWEWGGLEDSEDACAVKVGVASLAEVVTIWEESLVEAHGD
jgi:hypothetical protein